MATTIEEALLIALEKAINNGYQASSCVVTVLNVMEKYSESYCTHDRVYKFFLLNEQHQLEKKEENHNNDNNNHNEPKINACFTGNEFGFFRGISVSTTTNRMIFMDEEHSIYCVDCIGSGAFYAFGSYEDALNWATHKIHHKQAREACLYWTPHSKKWEDRVFKYLYWYYTR